MGVAVGLGIGAAAFSADPTQSSQYAAVEAERDEALSKVAAAEDEVRDTRETARQALAEVAEREIAAINRDAELDAIQADLEAREAAVGAEEKRVAATQIRNGYWTVGDHIEPGTYRVANELTGYCYWAILRSGTNGSDIVDNDGPEGGFPTVTLSPGQDFENKCGVWNKIG
ncbi:hypothetical protein [Actinotalea sp. Marseille-Q4924]|uniref:hypothetical protein n=1 Tax=Actinotalea sp. Marseille-Q4924 TaxID=2866571 RepID=UPI001CE446A3|nr:hypothetical protein [Actinotalea sp. Marseille-Q4924]